MFVCTANSLNLPQPLLDRMEIIRLEGYTEDEKVEIAQRHLIAKQVEAHGLTDGEFELTEAGLRDLVRYYTREAAYERSSARSRAWRAKACAGSWKARRRPVSITPENLAEFAGCASSSTAWARKKPKSARSPGSLGPRSGASCLTIESVTTPGKGEIKTTGKLGEVMTESVAAAFSFVKARAPALWHQAQPVSIAATPHPSARRRGAQGWPQRGRRHESPRSSRP